MPIRKPVILGSGSEAVTLALALMQSGIRVTLIEPDAGAAERARFFLTRPQAGDAALLAVATGHQPLCAANIVFESLEGTRIARLDTLSRLALPAQALLATTNRDALPGQTGFHLFAPSHLRRLVEITPVSAASKMAAFDLARDMARVPVLAPAGRPSIGTRLQRRLYAAAETLLLQGAIPHELDEALVDFGFDMGLFEAQDLIGLDVAYDDRRRTGQPAVIFDRMVQEGRLGKQAGVGWYRYPGGGGAVIDPLIEDLIREEARFARVETSDISAEKVQESIAQALIDESRSLLSDATLAADIDTVLVHGLGFPATPGGVLSHLRTKAAGA